uniref:Putative ovule protein n=1 Tax=Solanum chacoense TaxID=4108 RepID=A0A0V0GWH6_SOLCH
MLLIQTFPPLWTSIFFDILQAFSQPFVVPYSNLFDLCLKYLVASQAKWWEELQIWYLFEARSGKPRLVVGRDLILQLTQC